MFAGSSMSRAAIKVASWLPAAFATILLVLTFLRAITTVDTTWDGLAYHLQFSAQRVGLLPDWQIQRPAPERNLISAYYLGLPALPDLIRGWMWKLTGLPEAVNLLGLLSLLTLAAYLKWAFRQIEVAWVLIALFAVPAVQTAAAGNYVDVPAHAFFTIFLLSIVDLWTNPEKFLRPPRWVVLFLSAFAAANMKPQTSVLVFVAAPFLFPPVWKLLRARQAKPSVFVGAAALATGAAVIVAANLIKDFFYFGNPLYPTEIKVAGIVFPGPMTRDAWLIPGRVYENVPHAIVWLLSVLEYRALDGRPVPYTNGMGNVPWTMPSAALGGFFSALVVASICFLVLGASQRRDRLGWVFLATAVISTVLTAFLPNYFNLRYSLYWIMLLVIGCLLLLSLPTLRSYLLGYKIILISSLVFVTSVTSGVHFIPEFRTAQAFVDQTGVGNLLERVVQAGDTICLEQGAGEWDSRFTILLSPIFHQKIAQERPYSIREGDCRGFKTLSRPK
jgi:hypothetical protein